MLILTATEIFARKSRLRQYKAYVQIDIRQSSRSRWPAVNSREVESDKS